MRFLLNPKVTNETVVITVDLVVGGNRSFYGLLFKQQPQQKNRYEYIKYAYHTYQSILRVGYILVNAPVCAFFFLSISFHLIVS